MPFITVGTGVGGSGGGSLSVPNDLRFATIAARDAFFVANPTRLKEDVVCMVGTTTVQLFQYMSGAWKEITPIVKGDKGTPGIDAEPVTIQYNSVNAIGDLGWFAVPDATSKFIRFSTDGQLNWSAGFKFVADEVKYVYSIDGVADWTSTFDSATQKYAKISIDNGATFSGAFKISADLIVYEYGESEIGPWSLTFDKDLRPWGRISIDSGRTFTSPFRFVAQDGLSFIAQYAPSELGPWSVFFQDGVHEYVRFSNDNQNTWTPGQRFKAIPFGVNAEDRNVIDIGGHKIISNNENMAFRNIFTGDNFYPVWQGISNDGLSIYRAAEVIFEARQNRTPLNGAIDYTKVVDYNFTRPYAQRVAILQMSFAPAEVYTGDIKFQIWSQGGLVLIYSQTMRNVTTVDRQEFIVAYQGNLFVQPGNILNVRIVKADGTPLKAYAGATIPTEPWRVIDILPMRPVQLFNREDGADIARTLEALQGPDRLSINALKDIDDLKVGTLRGDIDFTRDFSQFVPATKSDYWKSDREIAYGGLLFKPGDRLYIKRNVIAGEVFANLIDPTTFMLDRNMANIAKPNEVGLVMPSRNTLVSVTGELYVRPATALEDGVMKLGVPGGAAKLGEDGKVSVEQLPPIDTLRRVSVPDEVARLALPVANRFTIAIQIDTKDQWYLDAFSLPSIKANWVFGGSVAATVLSFNTRPGHVLPQAGDYTAEMVGAVKRPATNDGKRRVVVGDQLVEEETISDVIVDVSTAKKYKIMMDLGVPYFEEVV